MPDENRIGATVIADWFSIEKNACTSTVTAALVTLSTVTVIWAVPIEDPVTTPCGETCATGMLFENHVIARP
jgi:hypothetical protein